MAVRGQIDLASALSTLTTAVQRNSERIVRLESGLGVNVDEEYSQLHQQSAQLMEVASAVERLTDAVTRSDQQRKREIKELWSVIHRMQGHAVVEVDDPRDEVHMRIQLLERRFNEIEKTINQNPTDLFNKQIEELKVNTDRKFASAKEYQDHSLSRKANFSDVEMLLSDKADQSYIASALLNKADISDLHKVSGDVVGREEIRLMVKSEVHTVGDKVKDYEKLMRDIQSEVETIKVRDNERPSNRDNLTHSDTGYSDNRRQQLEEDWVRRLCSEEASKAVYESKKYSESAMESIATQVVRKWESDPESMHQLRLNDTKADILEGCSKSLEKARKELSSEISQLRERGDNSVLKLVEALNAKCFKGDVARALKEKVDVEGLESLVEGVFDETSDGGERLYTWVVARMKEEGYLMNSLVSLLERKADHNEVSGALSRTAHSVDGLLDDLSLFKTEIRKQFDALASELSSEQAQAFKQEKDYDENVELLKKISQEECAKYASEAIEDAVKRLQSPKLVSEMARQEVRHVARGLVQQLAQEEVPEEVRQALEKSLQLQQLQCELNMLIERIVRVEGAGVELKDSFDKDVAYRAKNTQEMNKEMKSILKSELSVDLSVEVQRLGDEFMSRQDDKLSDLVKQVSLAAEDRVNSAAGAAANSAARATIDFSSQSKHMSSSPQSAPLPAAPPPVPIAQSLSPSKQLLAPNSLSGRWLWRSGHLEDNHWIPWEVEALNSSPNELIWTAKTTSIIAKIPGLYKLTFGFFTHATITIEVCLNGEPILTRCPIESTDKYLSNPSYHGSARMAHEALYEIRRNRHSVGDVTSAGVDEYVALPAGAAISIRMESSARAQGFLALVKL